ncbi:MAG: CotH kinase family protein [Draconibacterium sp.]|nr:CotH kinase family protein [Draconibacterium sp.]
MRSLFLIKIRHLKLVLFLLLSCSIGKQSFAQLNENLLIRFSHERNLYNQPFELELTSSQTGALIKYTLDCSEPTESNGITYSTRIPIDSTIVVKAIVISSGESSPVFTQTFIFPESSARQGKLPEGFPELWGGAKTIAADYEMDPEVINDTAYSEGIVEAFESLPSLSLSMDIEELFNHESGLYRGYPNTNVTTEKPVTAEFIFNNNEEESFVVECGVQNQGGTSIVKWKSPKQSMRILFKEIYGPTRLRKKLFPDSEINSINTLVVDAMLNATWIHPRDDDQRLHALYMRDQLTSDLYNKMGRLSFHGRYFHLYLNGIYWGIINLHERPDDAFLSEYLDAEREEFDVVKHKPDNVVSGSNFMYVKMIEAARGGFSGTKSLDYFKYHLDIPAFIDYMILNFYLGNQDWARHNWYAGKKVGSTTGFRFYPWDSEHVMRFLNLNFNNTLKNDEGAPTEIHTYLKENEEYRMMFADAVYKHMFNDGALTPENFEKSFRFRMNEIEKAIVLESARWGDYRESVSGLTYTKNDYWLVEANNALKKYIPNRRDVVIEQFRDDKNRLFPHYMPPLIKKENKNEDAREITLTSTNTLPGQIFYTLDGTDPRQVGGGINGIEYSDKISINSTTILKARYYTKGQWSALAEEVFLFDDVYGEGITINEIMYHPQEEYPEFIELMNYGETTVNLKGFNFWKGIDYSFKEDYFLEPETGVVLTDKASTFEEKYKFNAYGQYEKRLSNSGESIYLNNSFGQLVDSVNYSDSIPWPEEADGEGHSLQLISSSLDNALSTSWRISDNINGSPYGTVRVNIDADFTIYPNPFTDRLVVHLNKDQVSGEIFTVEVFNQLGSKIRSLTSSSLNSKFNLNLAGITPGIYYIRVSPDKMNDFKGGVLKAVKLK